MIQLIVTDEKLAHKLAQRVLVSDFEGSLWQCEIHLSENLLTVGTETEGTCHLQIPWLAEDGSELMLSTATLLQRERPYQMELELARGTINRLLNHVADWKSAGFDFPNEIIEQLTVAKRSFIRAIGLPNGSDEANHAAGTALIQSVRLLRDAVPTVTRLLANSQNDQSAPSNKLLAGTLPSTLENDSLQTEDDDSTQAQIPIFGNAFCEAFDTAMIPFEWAVIQPQVDTWNWGTIDQQLHWCQNQQLRTVAGPLLQVYADSLPDWYLQATDESTLIRHAESYAKQAASRYASKVNLWYAASGMNLAGLGQIKEESRLRMTAICIESIREIDSGTPVMVGFDQPWGEYTTNGSHDLAPIEFADTLIRAGLGISAIGLELNFDIWPNGTTRRDAFTLLEQLNRWSHFQLPLVIIISAPSQSKDIESPGPDLPKRAAACVTYQASDALQSQLVQDIVPLLRAHPVVQGIVWNQWTDADATRFPHAGLVTQTGEKKAAFETWSSILRTEQVSE